MRHTLMIALLLAPLPWLPGCNCAYFLLPFAPPEPTVTVPAEFDGLQGRTVAVVIYMTGAAEMEYPRARAELSMLLAHELKQHVKGVNVVDVQRSLAYQQQNMHWDSMPKTELGEALGGDMLLYVTIAEFSTREPGSMGLYRGRITGEAKVYDMPKDERNACVWRGRRVGVVHPPHSTTLQVGGNDLAIREQAERLFARALVKKFYKHKAPKEQ